MRKILDLLYGVLLFCGVPLAALLGPSYLLLPFIHNEVAEAIIVRASLLLTLIAWVGVIVLRFRRRTAPRWLLIVEILVGTMIGFFIFAVLGAAVQASL
jgi:type III secretory pathway component EscT